LHIAKLGGIKIFVVAPIYLAHKIMDLTLKIFNFIFLTVCKNELVGLTFVHTTVGMWRPPCDVLGPTAKFLFPSGKGPPPPHCGGCSDAPATLIIAEIVDNAAPFRLCFRQLYGHTNSFPSPPDSAIIVFHDAEMSVHIMNTERKAYFFRKRN